VRQEGPARFLNFSAGLAFGPVYIGNMAKEKNVINMLRAVASIVGLDRSIEILEQERGTVTRALALVTVGDLSDAFAPRARAKSRSAPRPQEVPMAIVPTEGGGLVSRETDIAAVCGQILGQDGPTPIREILRSLAAEGIIPDESPASRRQVVAILDSDKTFSVKTRGVYRLRVRADAA
jgi:hypothetical protein